MDRCASPISRSSASSPAGSSRSTTSCARRTSRPTRCATCSPWPTTRPARCGTDLHLGYTESTGHPLLRARDRGAVRDDRARRGPRLRRGRGGDLLPRQRARSVPGDHAIVTWPGYQSLYEVARATGADVTLHELHEDATAGRIDLDRARAGSSRRRPGSSWSTRRTTRPGCSRTGRHSTGSSNWPLKPGHTCSSTRSTAASNSTKRIDCRQAPTQSAAGLSLGVMSKAFAMAGLRIGWLATHDRDLLAAAGRVQGLHDDLLRRRPSEILAIIALRAGDRVLARSRGIVAANLDRLDGVLRRLGGPVRLDPSAWPARSGSRA